jgi:DHA1 family inner membrane transport protein
MALAALFLGMFVQGSAELLVVGVLNLIAVDLSVSISAAGTLVTAYAVGFAIGGPILTALTIRLDRRAILVGTLSMSILANLVAVLTADYGAFLAARTVAGAVQGLFIAAAFAAGIAVVPPDRMGRAMAVVISGTAVSAALGVPLGTLVGHALGWRGSFAAVVVFAAAALLATLLLVPAVPSRGAGAGSQARYAFAPRVLAVLVLNFLVFGSVFAALTYIVPFLETVTGVSGALVSVFLLAYGVATAVGSFGGGRFADVNAPLTLIVGTIGLAGSLLSLYAFGAVAPLVALAMLAWGLFAFGMAASLQYRVVSLAGPGGPLAQSLPASAINLGIAFGSFAGGWAVSSYGAPASVVTGLTIGGIAIVAAWATRPLRPPTAQEVVASALTSRPAEVAVKGRMLARGPGNPRSTSTPMDCTIQVQPGGDR